MSFTDFISRHLGTCELFSERLAHPRIYVRYPGHVTPRRCHNRIFRSILAPHWSAPVQLTERAPNNTLFLHRQLRHDRVVVVGSTFGRVHWLAFPPCSTAPRSHVYVGRNSISYRCEEVGAERFGVVAGSSCLV
jgi:hypothetical protein